MCVCDLQNEDDPGEGCSSQAEAQIDPRTERSLEECRKLIQQWASELQSVDKVKLTVLQKKTNISIILFCSSYTKNLPKLSLLCSRVNPSCLKSIHG